MTPRAFHRFLCFAVSVAFLPSGCVQAHEPSAVGFLPSMAQEADAEPFPSPALCDWAASVDAIVVGRIAGLSLVTEPSVVVTSGGGSGWRWTPGCDGPIDPALAIDLNVEHVLTGDIDRSTPLRVYIGRDHLDMFNPMPTRGKNGTIAWLDTNESDLRSPLRVGQTLGVSLHSISIVQPNEWSLMGEALFTLDANGRIRVQDRIGEAVEPAPTGLEGMTLDTLEDALRACDAASPTADARRTLVHNLWGPKGRSPAHYRAAVCHATVDTPHAPGACHVDSDCLDGERCQNATCVRLKD